MNDVNNADEQNSNETVARTKSNKGVRFVLLLLIFAAAAGIYMYHQRELSIDGWGSNIDVAMVQAGRQHRPVVVFFVGQTPGSIAHAIKNKVISKRGNQKALAAGKFIKVIVIVDSGLTSAVAQKHKLVKLPTLIAFDSSGEEYSRLEGTNAKDEVGFRDKLLKRGE